MPSDKDIIESIERILCARKEGAISVSVHDAITILSAYRELCYKSIGVEDYNGE